VEYMWYIAGNTCTQVFAQSQFYLSGFSMFAVIYCEILA